MTVLNNILLITIAILLALILLAFLLIPTPVFPLGLGMYIAGLSIMSAFVVPVIVLYTVMQTFTQEVLGTSGPTTPSIPKIKKRK
jgi:hypothetical protein